ncbi:antitoxin MazE family protein [Paraburkholderia hospita]|uniref:antitoxin MazE family protein n=1 Tax=Paraburkholderia hospita TaxID=169430 RepID=UPI003ECE9845
MTSRRESREQREAMRRAGLRPITIWVPDTTAPGFAEECARQSRAVAQSSGEKEDMDFIERITKDEWE